MGSKEKKNQVKTNLAPPQTASSLDLMLTPDAMQILMRGLAYSLLLLAKEVI